MKGKKRKPPKQIITREERLKLHTTNGCNHPEEHQAVGNQVAEPSPLKDGQKVLGGSKSDNQNETGAIASNAERARKKTVSTLGGAGVPLKHKSDLAHMQAKKATEARKESASQDASENKTDSHKATSDYEDTHQKQQENAIGTLESPNDRKGGYQDPQQNPYQDDTPSIDSDQLILHDVRQISSQDRQQIQQSGDAWMEDIYQEDDAESNGEDRSTDQPDLQIRVDFFEENPLLTRIVDENKETIEVYFGDMWQVFNNEQEANLNYINETSSDELTVYLAGIDSSNLSEQVATRDKGCNKTFWSIWQQYMQSGLVKKDHLRHIYDKLDKETFLKFFECLHQDQQANQQMTVGQASTVTTTPRKSKLGTLLMACLTGKQSKMLVDSPLSSNGSSMSSVCQNLFNSEGETTTTSTLTAPSRVETAPYASVMSPWRYASHLPEQQQRTPEPKLPALQPAAKKVAGPTGWKKWAKVLLSALTWTGMLGVAVGLGLWAHTVLSPLPIMKAQSIWLLLACSVGVGIGWLSAVVMLVRQGQEKSAAQDQLSITKKLSVLPASSTPVAQAVMQPYIQYPGVITAIDKTNKTVSVQAQDGSQYIRDGVQLLPSSFCYRPTSSTELDQFGNELEQRSGFADKPAVSVIVDERNGLFSMKMSG